MQRFTLEKVYFGKPELDIQRFLIDSPHNTIEKTCRYLHIQKSIVMSKSRLRTYCDARSMLTALFRYHSKTKKPYAEIGRLLNRDHATAINSLKRHADMTTVNKKGKPMHPQYVETYDALCNDLCYVFDPNSDKKIIYGRELRLAIEPQQVASNDWLAIMELKFDLIYLKNLIDQHPLLNGDKEETV